ncbi:malonyl-CoA decarboxylase, mitochondrial isoform X2 [Cephus cinctus]|uniref:Malonyl-CoA decarboxylase, mitochondrial isoform X2 n=1 Tax=Cephus cinctus TaxID=211228 RepID=A0AAJ7FT35_CEPCN|nr:malonyl-CoA decarboxylase, mitochondrial isoform X2 [Cephus cinctus]
MFMVRHRILHSRQLILRWNSKLIALQFSAKISLYSTFGYNDCVLKLHDKVSSSSIVTIAANRIRTLYTDSCMDKQLEEIFALKDTNISNWAKIQSLCCWYSTQSKYEKQSFIRLLAYRYAVNHNDICQLANKLVCSEPDNQKQMIINKRLLKNALTPVYQWLFVLMGRLEYGVKFLVDLRTDVLELISETKEADQIMIIQQLNLTLQELLLLWFSVSFLHLERITWQSSCDILQKVSDYEAIHPIRNWIDLKRRVGPYRRCYVFTHPSMPREPLVVLHTALCDEIPTTVKGIQEAEQRILGMRMEATSFLQEDKNKIKAAIFYSIASTQKGLQGIELGNYLIKEVVKTVINEFPMIDQLSSLSPIPNFRLWLLDRIKQNAHEIFNDEEYDVIQKSLESKDLFKSLKKTFDNSLWMNDHKLITILEKPLVRACARYLYTEKRRNYALNSVANFHLRNGAVMWRINWLADPSPRGSANSCGIMVNYRYFVNETETNSRDYIEKKLIRASESVISLAEQAEELKNK